MRKPGSTGVQTEKGVNEVHTLIIAQAAGSLFLTKLAPADSQVKLPADRKPGRS